MKLSAESRDIDWHGLSHILREVQGLTEITEIMPARSGVYFLCFEGQVVYVGQSISVLARVVYHIHEGKKRFDRVFYVPCPVSDLNRIEAAFIRLFEPRLCGRPHGHFSVPPVPAQGDAATIAEVMGMMPVEIEGVQSDNPA